MAFHTSWYLGKLIFWTELRFKNSSAVYWTEKHYLFENMLYIYFFLLTFLLPCFRYHKAILLHLTYIYSSRQLPVTCQTWSDQFFRLGLHSVMGIAYSFLQETIFEYIHFMGTVLSSCIEKLQAPCPEDTSSFFFFFF